MGDISNEDKLESVKSLLSTMNKLENALSQMDSKGGKYDLGTETTQSCLHRISYIGKLVE